MAERLPMVGRRSTRSRRLTAVVTALLLGTAAGARAQEEPPGGVPRAKMLTIPADSISLMVGGRLENVKTGEPIPGARVFLPEAWPAIETRTDRFGWFRLQAREPGAAELHVRLINGDVACFNIEVFEAAMVSLLIALPEGDMTDNSFSRWGCRDPVRVPPPSP